MHQPKIVKFKGGYSADAELSFHLWHMDILAHKSDREVDNKAVIKLIKDHTLESACHEVEFQFDLCGSEIQYQDLLKHLSIAFQGGNKEVNILAEFYSCAQHAKESEEVFVDELQLLARKVISKKPNFRVDLDTTLEQRYANQLYYHNSASIAKTLLLQMPKVSFIQFRNELARVLGTHQCSSKTSRKSLSTSSIGVRSEEKGTDSKSQLKQEQKISTQSSQIKDLWTKLDGAVAENVQIWELLSPAALQTAFTSILKATQFGAKNSSSNNNTQTRTCRPFLDVYQEPQLAAGIDGSIDPEKSCNYCKDTGHDVNNCLCLQK